MKKLLRVLGHVAMLSVVALIATYWGIKILTPPPASAPPPLAAPPPRDPDPVLAARMLGLVQAAQTVVVSNIQVSGVFAAGPRDSAAVLAVDGKPARAYLVGQEIAPGTSLESVRPDGVTLSGASGKQDVRIPPRPVASFGGAPPPPAFSLSGNTLSAPSETPAFARPAPPPPQANPAREPPPPQPQANPAHEPPPPQPAPNQPPPNQPPPPHHPTATN